MAPSAIYPAYEPQIESSTSKFNDWRDDLHKNGYAVIKNAIPRHRADSYREQARQWLQSFGKGIDYNDPSTWNADHLPVQSKINTFSDYGLPHEKFMWDIRLEPEVIDSFAKIWGTDKLLVSFDSLNVTFPNRKDRPRKPSWEHVDQSPFRKGLHCVQGVVNLAPSGPEDGGLLVFPGTHRLMEEFWETQTDKSTWNTRDIFFFSKEDLAWFEARGAKPHKVCADVGDLLVWDSRLIHYGTEPTERSSQIRTAVYVAYTPARLASQETLDLKRTVFEQWNSTTHWPHDNVLVRDNKPLLDDGTVDPLARYEPVEKPELTDKLLRLAGVKPY